MIKWFKSGSPWIWVTAGAVSLSLVAVLGLLLLIGYKGLSYFWPSPVYQFDIDIAGKNQTVIGELYDSKAIPLQQLREAGVDVSHMPGPVEMRYLIKIGNRERVGTDFFTVLKSQIKHQEIAKNIAVVDRETNGKFYGYPIAIMANGVRNSMDYLPVALSEASEIRTELKKLQQIEIADTNWHLEKLRLEKRQLALKDKLTPDEKARIERRVNRKKSVPRLQVQKYRQPSHPSALTYLSFGEDDFLPLKTNWRVPLLPQTYLYELKCISIT